MTTLHGKPGFSLQQVNQASYSHEIIKLDTFGRREIVSGILAGQLIHSADGSIREFPLQHRPRYRRLEIAIGGIDDIGEHV